MRRPLLRLARRQPRRGGALTALCLGAALAACQPARPPAPLDDPPEAPRRAGERVDAADALATARTRDAAAPDGDSAPPGDPGPDAAAPPDPRPALREETLPELAAPDSMPPGTTAAPAAGAAAGDAAAASGEFALQAPSPLASMGAATPPNVAAATRLTEAARLRLAAGDTGGALEQLEQAIAIDPRNGYAYYFLAELHLRHRTYDQAIAFAERAAELSTGVPEWASRAHELQGNAFEAAGRFNDARRAYGQALRLVPNNVAALSGLARTGAAPVAAPATGSP